MNSPVSLNGLHRRSFAFTFTRQVMFRCVVLGCCHSIGVTTLFINFLAVQANMGTALEISLKTPFPTPFKF